MSQAYRFAGAARVLRGLVLGAGVLLMTSVAHTVGDGTSPSIRLFTLLWLLPLAAALSVVAADRQRTFRWLTGYLLGVQGLLHMILVTTSDHGSHDFSMLPSAAMLAMHVLAALVVALVLSHGDAVLHCWLRLLAYAVIDRRLILPTTQHASAPAVLVKAALGTAASVLLSISPHRGPPLAAGF